MSESNGNSPISQTPPQVITFDEIPAQWEVPGTYVEVKPNYSQAGLVAYPAKVLIIAQMLADGQAQANTPYPVYSAAQAQLLFGPGSIAAQMADYFIRANPYVLLDMIGVPDAEGAVKASSTVTIGGAATAAGTLAFYLQGVRVPLAVSAGDAAATVAANLLAAIQDTASMTDPNDIGVSATNAGAVVTLTALHGGTLGNGLDARVNFQPGDMTPPGLTVTITPMAGGATDPSVSAALNAIATSWYTDIMMCWTDAANVALLEGVLKTRYGAMAKLDSHAYGALAMTYGAALANQDGLDCPYRSVLAAQNPPQPSWFWAASLGGVCSYNLANDPSRQLRGLALPGILAPAPADRFTLDERNLLLVSGISTFDVAVDGTVTLERVVTEYTTSAAGVPDQAYHDIMAPKVATRIRYDWYGYVDLLWPRNKLAPDGTIAAEYDPSVVTPSRAKASWAARSLLYERNGWIENSQQTAAQSEFEIDTSDQNRLDCRLQYQRIGNLMVLAASLEFQV